MPWYYAINGQRLGPVGQAEFEQLVASGVVKPDTLVWRTGMADWQPYVQVAGAGATPAPAPAVDDSTEVCAVSGKRFPRREMIQYEGKWISAERRDEFFQRLREGVAGPGHGLVPGPFGYGGFWRRFGAKFIDGLITGVAGLVINVILGMVLLGTPNYFAGVATAAGTREVVLYHVISNVLGVGLGLLYTWFFMSRTSSTPGKLAFGMKVVRPDGSKLGTGRIIGRHFAEIVSGLTLLIGYIIAGFDEEKRSLHDRMCDTRVIRTR